MERQTISVEEAGRILGVGRVTAYAAVHRGEIPALRIGKKILVPKRAVERMLEEATEMPMPARRGQDVAR